MVDGLQGASTDPNSSGAPSPLENGQALVSGKEQGLPEQETQKTARPAFRTAIEAKCHDCMAQYVDGKNDCGVTTCALYFFQPYRQLEPDLGWQQYYTRRVGLVKRDVK